jgi:hypothetical protein
MRIMRITKTHPHERRATIIPTMEESMEHLVGMGTRSKVRRRQSQMLLLANQKRALVVGIRGPIQ